MSAKTGPGKFRPALLVLLGASEAYGGHVPVLLTMHGPVDAHPAMPSPLRRAKPGPLHASVGLLGAAGHFKDKHRIYFNQHVINHTPIPHTQAKERRIRQTQGLHRVSIHPQGKDRLTQA